MTVESRALMGKLAYFVCWLPMEGGGFGSHTPRKLLLELAAVVGVMAVAAGSIWIVKREPPIRNDRPIGGRNVDISRSTRAQWAPTVAQDPSRPDRLIVAASDELLDSRLYTSEDGGRSWRGEGDLPLLRANCGRGDTSTAIMPRGPQLLAFLATIDCRPLDPRLYAAFRQSAGAPWKVSLVAPVRRSFVFDQRPALAAGRGGGVLAWLRFVGKTNISEQRVLVSHSSDGRSWSVPLVLPFQAPYASSVAVAPSGEVYVVVADAVAGVVVLRSRDGGRRFGPARRIAALHGTFAPLCGHGDVLVTAQPQRCIGPSPTISAGRDRLLVTYGRAEPNGSQGVFALTLDRDLSVIRSGRVGAPDRDNDDQFTPVSTIDRATGDLWVCFYDTSGDKLRKRAWFTCTVSGDEGRSWAPLVRAASSRSDETRFAADSDGFGDVQSLVASNGVAHPVWTDARGILEAEEIYTTRLTASRLLARH